MDTGREEMKERKVKGTFQNLVQEKHVEKYEKL